MGSEYYGYGLRNMNIASEGELLILTAPNQQGPTLTELPEASAVRGTKAHNLTTATNILLSQSQFLVTVTAILSYVFRNRSHSRFHQTNYLVLN